MALIGGALAGGGGLLGNLLLGAIGVGIKLAVAYFFPEKTEGPRAENLRAQTSKFGDHIARCYGNTRVAGAVIWLKNGTVDEHVSTEREGKALGPEVTSYTYTADFAVAFAWNGPFAAIPRIWADDKLIFDASAESLEEMITTSGPGIGTAEGATIQIYLGTDGQGSDPNIEANVGEGYAPAWPGVAYVVFTNFPLDEFGIRVPNMEAELVRAGEEATFSIDPDAPSAGGTQNDTNGNYYVSGWTGGALQISSLPSGTTILDTTLSEGVAAVHITDRGEVIVPSTVDDRVDIYDAATGILTGQVTGVLPATSHASSLIDDITIDGTTYVMIWQQGSQLSLISNDGSGYVLRWCVTTTHNPVASVQSLSLGPEFAYACHGFLDPVDDEVILLEWDGNGLQNETRVPIPGAAGCVGAHYFSLHDAVVVLDDTGSLFLMSDDLTTLLNSNTSTGITISGTVDPLWSKRCESDVNAFIVKDDATNDIHEFVTNTLVQSNFTDASATDWINKNNSGYSFVGINLQYRVILVVGSTGVEPPSLWYLPVILRDTQPLAEVIDAECRLAGLIPDVTQITQDIHGYPVRDGAAPRAVIEDLLRINFVDFAQIDGVITFFPRVTTSARTLTVEETGLVLNGDPDPIQVREEYPASYDVPEQVIITYQAYDALYRVGAQAANPDEDQPYGDEPSQADETGAPLAIRRKRPLEFSTNQVLTDDEAIQAADILFRDLQDAATVFKSPLGPAQLDLHPGEVITLPLSATRSEKVVITKMSGDTVLDFEFRKRGDGFSSDAVAQPTPYVVTNSLLNIANGTPALIDGHLLRAADDDDNFYMGVAVTTPGQFRSAVIYRSEDGGASYSAFVAMSNGLIRGFAQTMLPDMPHPDALDRTTEFVIAIPQGTAPASITEAQLLSSETSNAFAVYNSTLGDWEYIRAANVVDNLDGTWTLSTLIRGGKGTEFAMAGHAIGNTVYVLDAGAMVRSIDADRTLPRLYVAVPTGKQFSQTGAVTFTNQGKGLRPWSPTDLDVQRDGSGNITGRFSRRDRLGQAWPESGSETPPMSEDSESYKVRVYDGGSAVRTINVSSEAFTYSAADQTSDFGSVQDEIEFGIVQVSATYGDGIELRETA